MIIDINEKEGEKYFLTPNEALVLTILFRNQDRPMNEVINESIDALIEKKAIFKSTTSKNGYAISLAMNKAFQNVAKKVNKKAEEDFRKYEDIAEGLRECYPSGTKGDSRYLWKQSVTEIATRLRDLVVKYHYTLPEKEKIIDACKRYVNSFNGDYKYMLLLKYFIYKVKPGEHVEFNSELMNYLENDGVATENYNNDWTAETR